MKPFDVERAKAGDPVVTANGDPVRILCFDAVRPNYPIVAMMMLADSKGNPREHLVSYTSLGHIYRDRVDEDDLCMAPLKRQGWINLYTYNDSRRKNPFVSGVYLTEEKAELGRDCSPELLSFNRCIHIEWEE